MTADQPLVAISNRPGRVPSAPSAGKGRLGRLGIFAAWALALLAAGSLAAAADAQPQYAIVREPVKTIKAIDQFEISAPDFTAKVWVLIAAKPPELPSQSATSARLFPDGKPTKDLSGRKRALLRAQVAAVKPALKHGLAGRAEYQATLYRRDLVPRDPDKTYPPAEGLPKAERTLSLAESPTLDFSSDSFQRWMDEKHLRKTPDESDLDYARRVFLAITHSYTYFYSTTLDRHVSVLCHENKTDCGGMCTLFAGTLRANQVPVRLLLGHLATSEDPNPQPGGKVSHRGHVKAEFYAQDIGWVPVDLSAAVEFDKTPDGLRFFGHDKGEFITLHVDYDLEYDAGPRGVKTSRQLQNVPYYVSGSGKLDSAKIDHRWTVETVD